MLIYPHVALYAGKEAPMKKAKQHLMKVYESPGCGPAVPVIRLQGKWLLELGYEIGERIVVSVKGKQLTIQLADPALTSADKS